MIDVVFEVAVLVVGGLGGAVAHELTHWATAWLAKRPATVDWWGMETYWRDETGDRDWADILIGVAPVSLGLGGGVFVFTSGITLPLWAWVGWGIYTFNGSLADLRGGESVSETESPSATS